MAMWRLPVSLTQGKGGVRDAEASTGLPLPPSRLADETVKRRARTAFYPGKERREKVAGTEAAEEGAPEHESTRCT